MGKRLSIKGHPTRGKEIIELLKMMGGDNIYSHWNGDQENMQYFINEQGNIDNWCLMANRINYEVFTLEEFLEKCPFKVGDKVNVLFKSYIVENEYCESATTEIKSMRWNETLGKVAYKVKYCSREFYKEELKPYKETNMNENTILNMSAIDYNNGLVGYEIPEGYEFDTVIDNKIILKLIKPKYPTTYEECYDEGNTELHFIYVDKDERDLYESFIQLIRCRNAYWKIAGEEMGLDNPWEPDWENGTETKYTIVYSCNMILNGTTNLENKILAFPTKEMRDAFYENFKKEIEQCKELL